MLYNVLVLVMEVFMKNIETKDFVAYEYMSINVKSDKEPLYVDCYENFGWELINNTALVDRDDYFINNSTNFNKLVNLKFKRDRKIKNKLQLMNLQGKMEMALEEINRLEKQPETLGIIWALIIGLIGTIFMAGSVFSVTATRPLYVLCVIFGFFGFIGWGLGYYMYLRVKKDKKSENTGLIEEQYNTLYDCCEQAKKLSN